MAKYAGLIGCRSDAVEVERDVFKEGIVEINATGDILFKPVRWSVGELSQDSAKANHIVSTPATQAIRENFSEAVYLTWQGVKWTVLSVDYIHPRVRFALGGKYNG